ncbi:MAG: glutamate--tRNA ligase [Nitrososphaeria archaeon]|nr:glutamate--tRNA ligase [Nitrososphaeria archaeon]
MLIHGLEGMELEKIILKWALKNAVDHGGKALQNAVIAKVLREEPSLKQKIKEIIPLLEDVVSKVNSMSLDEQIRLLEEVSPDLLEQEKKVEEKKLPPLPNAVRGRVVTRLPPEPSGHMHIGHAMSGLLNYIYAKMYDGKVWLRFEDTDPRKVKLEYYENFRKGYRWLGIEWDYEKNNSEDIELFYDYAEKLILLGKAYVCFCPVEKIRALRRDGLECDHRRHDVDGNLRYWRMMLDGRFKEGKAILRLVGDMSSQNTTLRDPAIFRIVEHPHPIFGSRYRVWPLYDFSTSIEDNLCSITHVLRTSEFAFRDELQNYIRELLGMSNPIYIEYSRFEFKGTPVSKRKLRAIIEAGLAAGWDDPRFPTIEGLKKRGIKPEAIREFTILHTGFSYAKREYDWSLLYAVNRRLLDPQARRFFFVPDPVKLTIEGLEPGVLSIPYHPTNKNLGVRKVEYTCNFYISRLDAESMKPRDLVRLKYLANFEVVEVSREEVRGLWKSGGPIQGMPIIQWVPGESYHKVKVLIPDILYLDEGEINPESLKIVEGYGELNIEDIEFDEVVQFERFGFCRREPLDGYLFIKAHD